MKRKQPELKKIRAAKGMTIPLIAGVAHNTAARALTDENAVEVYARHALVRRLLRDGDAVEDTPPPAKPKASRSPVPLTDRKSQE